MTGSIRTRSSCSRPITAPRTSHGRMAVRRRSPAVKAPCVARWPGKIPAGKVENGIFSGLDWFPTLVSAAGNPNIVDELKKGKQLGDRTYKVHLDGYDQTNVSPEKARRTATRSSTSLKGRSVRSASTI